ncbi:MAG: hypothetical protein QOJ19_632 [Acidimicrobiia bacterium]|nr:hypothetical protein [Acidimicrobiia bacterium]
MVYDLGIDVGTSFTAAAVRRSDGVVEVAGLGPIADNIPTVVYFGEDGSAVVGDSANRRAALDPSGAAREFKRRLGDPTPIILHSSPFSAESLIARMVEHVARRVADRERGEPRCTLVTHPANWGPYKQELFQQALRIANVEPAFTLTEPAAAALAYAAETRVPNGAITAVYDLGGGTFDAAVLRKTGDYFELMGESTGIEHLGGYDFDEAVFQYVRNAVGEAWPAPSNDPSLLAAMLALRRACTEAKELLSSENEAHIPVLLPSADTTVSLTRRQFERMIEPRIADTIRSLEAAVASAHISERELTSVLLVGGSSRIPLVADMVRSRFGSIVAVDIDPLYAVARGAAIEAGRRGAALSGDPTAAGPLGGAGNGSSAQDAASLRQAGFPRQGDPLRQFDPQRQGDPQPQFNPYQQVARQPEADAYRQPGPAAQPDPYSQGSSGPPADPYRQGDQSRPDDRYRQGDPYNRGSGPPAGVGGQPPTGYDGREPGAPPYGGDPGRSGTPGQSDRGPGPPSTATGYGSERHSALADLGPGRAAGPPVAEPASPARPGYDPDPPGPERSGPDRAGGGGDRSTTLPPPPPPGPPSFSGRRGPSRKLLLPVLVLVVVAGLLAALLVRNSQSKSNGPATAAPGEGGTTTTAAATTTASAAGMTPIAANSYWVGSANPDTRGQSESSRRQITLPAYFLDTVQVTNQQYLDFVNKNNAARPVQWQNGQFPAAQKDFPVKGVSYDWAVAYCTALGKRLPKEAEWEVAARGGTDQKYPWGTDEPIGRIADGGSYAVGTVPQNKSPFGVMDMAGNAWEWVAEPYDTQFVGPNDRVLRGGQNGYHRPNWTRLAINPAEGSAAKLAGFRCAASKVDAAIPAGQFISVAAPQTPAAPAPQPIPAAYFFCDDFRDPTTGWPEFSDNTVKKAYHPNRYYHLGTFGPNRVVAAKALPTFGSDQKIEVSVSAETVPELTDPPSSYEYGLFVRGDANGDGLTFAINRHPASVTWHIFQRVAGSNREIAHNEINANEPVTLRIRAVGDSYTFYLGDQYVISFNRPGMNDPFIGLYLASSESSVKTHIHFSNFEVRRADDAQHTPHDFCK